MTTLTLPFSQVDDVNAGLVLASLQANETVTALAPGFYKIAAMGQPLLFKIGANPVTVLTGSYLAAGDQEVIKIPGDIGASVPLRWIASSDSSADGEINLVHVELYELPATKPNGNYPIG